MERSIAMASTTSHAGERATYREYASWPDDGKRYEILDGEVVEMSSPIRHHQEVVAATFIALHSELGRTDAGRAWIAPFDVVLADDNVLQSDVMAVRTERLAIVRTAAIFGAPDLVVEVLSPSTGARDAVDKRRIYQHHGVREYWMVDPVTCVLWQFALENETFKEMGRFGADAEVASRAFPGLVVKLASIWPRTLPA